MNVRQHTEGDICDGQRHSSRAIDVEIGAAVRWQDRMTRDQGIHAVSNQTQPKTYTAEPHCDQATEVSWGATSMPSGGLVRCVGSGSHNHLTVESIKAGCKQREASESCDAALVK